MWIPRKKRTRSPQRKRNFCTSVRSLTESLEQRLLLTVDATIISPVDNGPADLDPMVGVISVSPLAQFLIQLATDDGLIDDTTVNANAVSVSVGGEPLVIGVDYTFSYNAASDQITLASVSPRFPVGTYDLIVSPNSQIRSDEGEALSPKIFQISVTNLAPTNFPVLNPLNPRGGLMYSNTVNVAAQSELVAGTSFEEPALNATTYTSSGQEMGWTRAVTNGTPGGNAVFGVQNAATGLGATAFPPPSGTKAYVSRGNTTQAIETLTFDPVDFTGRTNATFSIDVFRSSTGFENGDSINVTLRLSNSQTTLNQTILNLTGGAVGNSTLLTDDAYRTLSFNIPAQYTSAQLVITSSTNSGQNPPDEVLAFDNVQFRAASQTGSNALYAISLDAGQSLTAEVVPAAGFRPQVQVWGPGVSLVTVAAPQAGARAIVQNFAAPVAGRYLVSISGLDNTVGTSTLTLYANAAVELEPRGGTPNNTIATAQNIDGAFNVINGTASRAGVWGARESNGTDFYSFTLQANETAAVSIRGQSSTSFRVDLFDAQNNYLASGISADNGNHVINYFKAQTAGTYYVRVTSASSTAYGLVVAKNMILENQNFNEFEPPFLNQSGIALGYLEQFTNDYYRINLVAGQQIQITTTTPSDGPFEFNNLMNPDIELYDINFNFVMQASAGAADNRNVNVLHTPTQTGAYYLLINNYNTGNGTAGEYTLQVTGLEPALPPFVINSTSPFNGQSVQGAPGQFTFNFNRYVLPASVQASDLTVDGLPATAVSFGDGNTAIFTLPPIPAGISHTVQIAAGAISDVQGSLLDAYNGQFFVDLIAPRVVSSSIQEGELLPPGNVTYVVDFSESMNQFNLTNADFTLLGAGSQQFFTPESANFSANGTRLTIVYANLPDDHYTLRLISGSGAFMDLSGRALDGEPLEFPLPPAVSGDGVDGGDFFVSFDTDVLTVPMPNLVAQSPLGSMVYASASSGGILAGDSDRFTLELLEGQKISVAVIPTDALQPHLTIEGPLYNTMAASLGVGEEAVVQYLTVPASGQYAFRVAGVGGSTGAYQLKVILNAGFESEAHGGETNDSLATAQSIEPLMGAIAGTTARGAISGDLSIPGGFPGAQFATSVIEFSSQFSAPSWAATQALGVSDVFAYGDNSLAWAPSPQNGGMHFLTLGFSEPAFSDGVVIRESYGTGFVTQIDLLDVNDQYHTVWSGVDSSPAGTLFDFSPTWPATDYLVKGARIHVDTDHDQFAWEEIDSVQLLSPTPELADFYSVQATAGDMLSITADSNSGAVRMELLNANGDILATGASAGAEIDSAVEGYVVPSSGAYYVRVFGDFAGEYNLLAIRNATLGLEPNDSLTTAQNLTETHAALGFVTASTESEFASAIVTPPVPINLPIDLFDSAGFRWDLREDGDISDGTNDAYDGGMVHSGFPFLFNAQIEDGGREVIIGPTAVSTVQVTRKIYVPTDQNFARFLEIVTNPTSNPVNYTVRIDTNLGSDSGSQLISTSSGDSTFTTDDNWIVTDDNDNGGDPTLLHVISGPGAQRSSAVTFDTFGAISHSYALTLAPGQTQIVMHFASQNTNQANAIAKGPQLQNLTLGALEGMSAEELTQVVNFATADTDDYYSLDVAAGQVIDLRTFTTGDGLRGAANLLNPVLTLYDPSGGLIAIDGDSAGDGRNAHLRVEAPVTGLYRIHVGGTSGEGEYLLRAMTLGTPAVVGRQLFYNNSAFDGTAGPSASDDLAIATDKTALLPGGTATFSNYSSYSRGINGIMIDIAALPNQELSASDFSFKVGNDDSPAGWTAAPGPSVSVRGGAGVGGSDRVILIWPNQSIQKQWLQVTVLANANTGLATPDVFYFGNAIGESGLGNMAGYATVTATDEIGARNNPKSLFPISSQASITFPFDYNRDKKVGPADQIIARNNVTNVNSALRLITVPASALLVGAQTGLNASSLVASGLVVPTSSVAGQPATRSSDELAAPSSMKTAGVGAGSGSVDRLVVDNVFASYGASQSTSSNSDSLAGAEQDRWLELLARHRLRRNVSLTAAAH